MFKTYEELINAASFKANIEFEENKIIRVYRDGKESMIPIVNAVYIPGEDIFGMLVSRWFDDLFIPSKLELEFYHDETALPDPKGKEFYALGLEQGDENHGQSYIMGLFIEASYLDKRKDQVIEPDSNVFNLLEGMENFNPETDLDVPVKKLEDKLFDLKEL